MDSPELLNREGDTLKNLPPPRRLRRARLEHHVNVEKFYATAKLVFLLFLEPVVQVQSKSMLILAEYRQEAKGVKKAIKRKGGVSQQTARCCTSPSIFMCIFIVCLTADFSLQKCNNLLKMHKSVGNAFSVTKICVTK